MKKPITLENVPPLPGLPVSRAITTTHHSATVSYLAGDGRYLEETIRPQCPLGVASLGYGPRSRVLVIFCGDVKNA